MQNGLDHPAHFKIIVYDESMLRHLILLYPLWRKTGPVRLQQTVSAQPSTSRNLCVKAS
jgi:hypothetical protein